MAHGFNQRRDVIGLVPGSLEQRLTVPPTRAQIGRSRTKNTASRRFQQSCSKIAPTHRAFRGIVAPNASGGSRAEAADFTLLQLNPRQCVLPDSRG
jgi:hypothetical protein